MPYPGLAIFFNVLSFNIVGDGLRDAATQGILKSTTLITSTSSSQLWKTIQLGPRVLSRSVTFDVSELLSASRIHETCKWDVRALRRNHGDTTCARKVHVSVRI